MLFFSEWWSSFSTCCLRAEMMTWLRRSDLYVALTIWERHKVTLHVPPWQCAIAIVCCQYWASIMSVYFRRVSSLFEMKALSVSCWPSCLRRFSTTTWSYGWGGVFCHASFGSALRCLCVIIIDVLGDGMAWKKLFLDLELFLGFRP